MSALTQIDIYRPDVIHSARELVEQHADAAITVAWECGLAKLASGDWDEVARWCLIMRAIRELDRAERLPGEREH